MISLRVGEVQYAAIEIYVFDPAHGCLECAGEGSADGKMCADCRGSGNTWCGMYRVDGHLLCLPDGCSAEEAADRLVEAANSADDDVTKHKAMRRMALREGLRGSADSITEEIRSFAAMRDGLTSLANRMRRTSSRNSATGRQ